MARVWIEDRIGHAAYARAVADAKRAGRTPPGRYRVRWYDPDGKPKMKTFARKVDADAERTKMESRLNDGSYRDPAAARVKFAEVAESWLAAQIHLKRSTRGRYRGVLDVHVIPKWGTTPLDRINFEDIAEWLADLLSGEATGGRKLSPRSVRKAYGVLSRVLGYTVKARRLAVNPAVGVPLPKAAPADHVYLDDMQVDALANASGAYRVFILLMAYTGLRWGEASALKVGRLDLDVCRARIVEAYAEDNGKLYLDTPKNHERRSVPIPRFLAEELEPHVQGRGDEELLFTAPQGGPLRARLPSAVLRASGREGRAGTPQGHPSQAAAYGGLARHRQWRGRQRRADDAGPQVGDADLGHVRAPLPRSLGRGLEEDAQAPRQAVGQGEGQAGQGRGEGP